MATYEDRTRMVTMHQNNLTSKTTLGECGNNLMINLDQTATSKVFFSKLNLDALQTDIVQRVKAITQKDISRQSDYELTLVMRSVYLQYSNNNPTAVAAEVRWLNLKVLEYVVPNIISNMTQYMRYMSEFGKNPVPMSYAENMSNTGMRGLATSPPTVGDVPSSRMW